MLIQSFGTGLNKKTIPTKSVSIRNDVKWHDVIVRCFSFLSLILNVEWNFFTGLDQDQQNQAEVKMK